MFRVYPEIDPRLRPNSQFGLDLDTDRGKEGRSPGEGEEGLCADPGYCELIIGSNRGLSVRAHQ